MDKRQLESPAQRQLALRVLREHIGKLQEIGLQLEEKDIDVSTAMLDIFNAQQTYQRGLLVKLVSD